MSLGPGCPSFQRSPRHRGGSVCCVYNCACSGAAEPANASANNQATPPPMPPPPLQNPKNSILGPLWYVENST